MAGVKANVDVETRDVCGGSSSSIGGGSSFSVESLVDKLNNINNSEMSITTLSQWCIFHRKNARWVVHTWEKQFSTATKDKKISFLYLANDILQNSKRKGEDYVHEFSRILPRSLKHVYVNGGEGKKLVARLIEIWDGRQVFGTHIERLKHDIFGDNPPIFNNNGNKNNSNSNPSSDRLNYSKVLKKLTIGGMSEKIVTAYQCVLDQHFDEDKALNKCKSTVSLLEKMKKYIDDACTKGDQPASALISDLQKQETILKQCISKLESVEVARISLINQLKGALIEQESKSKVLHSHLHVAREEAEHAIQLRQQLGGASAIRSSSNLRMITPPKQTTATIRLSPQLQSMNPATSLAPTVSAMGDEPKRMAAALADKLASLSAPVQVLSSVLSSFVAEHGASLSSMNSGSVSGELSGGPPGFQIGKRPRLEKTVQGSDMGAPSFSGQPQMQQQIRIAPTQVPAQINQAPGPFAPPPPSPGFQIGKKPRLEKTVQGSDKGAPPFSAQPQMQQQIRIVPTQVPAPMKQAPGPFAASPPPLSSSHFPPLLQQFNQSTGGMMGMRPFGMMASSMPPLPPMYNIVPAGFPGPSGPPPMTDMLPPAQYQPQQQQSPQAPQQSPTSARFFQSSAGMGYFPPV